MLLLLYGAVERWQGVRGRRRQGLVRVFPYPVVQGLHVPAQVRQARPQLVRDGEGVPPRGGFRPAGLAGDRQPTSHGARRHPGRGGGDPHVDRLHRPGLVQDQKTGPTTNRRVRARSCDTDAGDDACAAAADGGGVRDLPGAEDTSGGDDWALIPPAHPATAPSDTGVCIPTTARPRMCRATTAVRSPHDSRRNPLPARQNPAQQRGSQNRNR